MSIWATWLMIEHPDQWIGELEAAGIQAGVIGDDSDERALGSPYVYEASHVLPEPDGERGGHIDVAALSRFVRYYREHPRGKDEPDGVEPWLRLGVNDATVILDASQVRALHATLAEWLNSACPNEKPASPPLNASNRSSGLA